MKKSSHASQKFALYEYTNSTNIGDEIQSIAARRFLPQIDYFINRDEIGDWAPEDKLVENVKLIGNAWYMSKPYSWPIKNRALKPLFLSVHVESEIQEVKDVFQKPESIEYLKKYQPIGCRDVSTENFLKGLGIETYFSGCLTLTLQRDPYIKKQEYIIAAGVTDTVYEKIKQQSDRTVIRIDSHSEDEDSFRTAEKYLYLYQSAHCVVTSRLHAMMPSLALETPVLFISDGDMTASNSRFAGLQELTHSLSEQEYLQKPTSYNVSDPPRNPDQYKILRAKLQEKCRDFTGYDEGKTFAKHIDFKRFSPIDCLDLIVYNNDYLTSRKLLIKNEIITRLQDENQHAYDNRSRIKKFIKKFFV